MLDIRGMASLGRADVVSAIVNGRSDGSSVVVVVPVGWPVMMMMVMVVTVVMASIVGIGSATVGIAGLLPLAVFLVLHPSILKPYLDLTFRQIQIARQFPAFLFRNVGIEQELFL